MIFSSVGVEKFMRKEVVGSVACAIKGITRHHGHAVFYAFWQKPGISLPEAGCTRGKSPPSGLVWAHWG